MSQPTSSNTPSTDQIHNNKFVYLTAIFAALGGLLFGYDTGVISGAIIFIRKDFNLTTFALEVVVSGALFGAVIGALLGGRFADRYGRRKILILTSIIFALGSLIMALAPSPEILTLGRAIAGLAIGLSSTTVPVYISEVSPTHVRGWMVSLFQLAITVGILAAYFVNYAFAASSGWRWMLGLAIVPSAIFGAGMTFLPESPRWLASKGRFDRATAVLKRIRNSDDVDAEISDIKTTLAAESHSGVWSDLFSQAVRPALIVGIGLAIFQQITGINTVIYYAPTIIQSAGISSASGAILATAGVGVVNVIMTIVAMRLIDRLGRRPLLLIGITGMILSLLLLGLVFYFGGENSSLRWVAVISLMAYVASFAIGLGPIFWLLIAEIYPLKIRGLAESSAATVNWGANLIVSLTFLSLVELLGASFTFWLYGLLAIFALLFTYFFVPETKERSLEEIESFWRRNYRNETIERLQS